MKNKFALIAAAILATSSAQAAIIFQTQNYSNVGTTPATLTWDKFDLNLGTLTAITLEATGGLTGSFGVLNGDPTSADISDSSGRLRLTFLGVGAPSILTGGFLSPINTTPDSGTPGTTVAGSASQIFTLTGVNTLPSINSNQLPNSAYYSALGGGTFDVNVSRLFNVLTSGSSYTVDSALTVAAGTINLTYEYTPSSAIPEPGTWAAAVLLAGGAAFARWRKRKSA